MPALGNLGVLMLQHLRTILLATGVLVVVGAAHTLSAAVARPVPAKVTFRTEPERPSSAAVSSMAGASLRSISIGF
jgi:hypothetical protein